jgi:hypothetical protein
MGTRTTRWWTAALTAAMTTVAGTAGSAIPAAATPSVAAATDDCVRPLTVQSVDAIAADGRKLTGVLPAEYAKSYSLALYPGDGIREVVPPPSWRPLTATDQELDTYGFPPRPKDADGLAGWTATMSGWKSAGKPQMCETSIHNTVTHEERNPVWAGGMAVNGSATVSTFTSSDGKWYMPTFLGTCANSAYGIWSGLGGANSTRLIQAGVNNTTSALNSGRFFWEMVADIHHDTNAVYWPDPPVSAGSDIESYVSWSGSSAFFFVYDASIGISHSIVVSGLIAGLPVASYYDGTTADFITEAPYRNHSPTTLRRASAGATTYYYAVVNGQPIANFLSWRERHTGINGRDVETSSFDGRSAWNDFWVNCN